jgi:general secretion pathway protein K
VLSNKSNCGSSDGFIIVAVLWILGALATLVLIYSLYVRETAAAFAVYNDRLNAQALAQAGVELAVYKLTADPQSRPSQGNFQFRMGGADVAVDFRSENARIDLNIASKELLAGLFAGFGASREQAEAIAERIVAWRTPPTPGASDDEAALYRTAGKNFGPRRAPFQHVNELGMILGLTPTLVDRALPYVTVYSGQAEVNVLDAAPEVLAALPGLTPERLNDLLANRAMAPLDALTASLGMAARYVTTKASNASRITVDVAFEANRHVRYKIVVLLLNGDTEPYRVLSWRDLSEAPDEWPKASAQ